MKYYFTLLLSLAISFGIMAQGGLPESFFDGKAVVMISVDPASKPTLTWNQLADSLHTGLIDAGADPVAYYELETIALSENRQAAYAKAFESRQIKNIIFITQTKRGLSVHMGPFSGDGKIIPSSSLYGVQGADLEEVRSSLAAIGEGVRTQNLLVIDVPEFGESLDDAASAQLTYLPDYPLNLEIFKTGVPIAGSSATESLISLYRFDLYGKSEADVLQEQASQKATLESVLNSSYPFEYVWLTEAKTNQELISERIQFVLSKVEGRESDLMESMGLEPRPGSETRVVVKYFIKLLVRDELYIGNEWDADPDWRKALSNFLSPLKK